MRPDAPVEALRPFITERLTPLTDWDPTTAAAHSDYDLAPDLRPERSGLTDAAVLVPLVVRPGGLDVILTRRAEALRKHSGQVAFPGGRCDPGETPWEAALREAEEEIGLDPARVEVVGLASPYETVTGYRIVPVVGFVRPGFTLTPNPDEVAAVFETPFAWLMDPASVERRFFDLPEGRRRWYYAMPWQDEVIWGATAGVIAALRDRLFPERGPPGPPLGLSDNADLEVRAPVA